MILKFPHALLQLYFPHLYCLNKQTCTLTVIFPPFLLSEQADMATVLKIICTYYLYLKNNCKLIFKSVCSVVYCMSWNGSLSIPFHSPFPGPMLYNSQTNDVFKTSPLFAGPYTVKCFANVTNQTKNILEC